MDEEKAPPTDRVSLGANGRPQLRAVRRDALTAPRRQKFIDHLAETCNVSAAARHAGILVQQAYRLRRRDPGFAQAWREALEIGYERLEAALLRYSLEALNPQAPNDPLTDGPVLTGAPTPTPVASGLRPADVQLALSLMQKHREAVKTGARSREGLRPASAEETDAALRRQLDALAKRLKAQRGE